MVEETKAAEGATCECGEPATSHLVARGSGAPEAMDLCARCRGLMRDLLREGGVDIDEITLRGD